MSCSMFSRINSITFKAGDTLEIYWSRWDRKANKNHPDGPGGYDFGKITIRQLDGNDHIEIIVHNGKPKITREIK